MGLTRRSGEEASKERRFRDRTPEGLLEQLREADPVARRWAAHDLADFADAAPALLERLSAETERPVQSAILNSLARNPGPAVVRGLMAFLRCEDAWLRNSVIETLGQLPHDVAGVVEELLRDESSDVRLLSLGVVSMLPLPQVPGWLFRAATEDEHPNVVAAALEGLIECATAEMAPELERLKHRFRAVPFVVFAADLVIKRVQRSTP